MSSFKKRIYNPLTLWMNGFFRGCAGGKLEYKVSNCTSKILLVVKWLKKTMLKLVLSFHRWKLVYNVLKSHQSLSFRVLSSMFYLEFIQLLCLIIFRRREVSNFHLLINPERYHCRRERYLRTTWQNIDEKISTNFLPNQIIYIIWCPLWDRFLVQR